MLAPPAINHPTGLEAKKIHAPRLAAPTPKSATSHPLTASIPLIILQYPLYCRKTRKQSKGIPEKIINNRFSYFTG